MKNSVSFLVLGEIIMFINFIIIFIIYHVARVLVSLVMPLYFSVKRSGCDCDKPGEQLTLIEGSRELALSVLVVCYAIFLVRM